MMNAFKDIKVELNFFEPILGSLPADKEIYSKYILGKLEEQGIAMPDSKKDQELDSIDPQEEIDNKVTVYPRNEDGQVCFWDYQIRGFFKGSCGMLRMVPGTESSKLKNYKKKIDGLVFVQERMVPIEYEGDIDIYQRPLRAQTMQGDRVALAMSERVPKGAKVRFTIRLFDPELAATVYEWLDYGRYNGIGQFRNGSFGRFTWRDISDETLETAPETETPEKEEVKATAENEQAKKIDLEDNDFLSKIKSLHDEGLSDVQIAHRFNMKTAEFRNIVMDTRKRAKVMDKGELHERPLTARKNA